MNIVQMYFNASILNDRESSARFLDEQYMYAINAAIVMTIEDRVDNIKKPKKYSLESVQRVRDELYTLIPPTSTIVPVGNVIAYPLDYSHFLKLQVVIDGETSWVRPTNYNESGPLADNPWKKPSNTKPYFDQDNAGIVIYRGATGSFTSALLDYLKTPAKATMGNETNKILPGALVLTIGLVYVAYDDSVHNGVTYVTGTTFTAVSTVLTSGTVILYSLVTNCDLPEKIHGEVVRLASAIMSGTISDMDKKQDLKNDNKDS